MVIQPGSPEEDDAIFLRFRGSIVGYLFSVVAAAAENADVLRDQLNLMSIFIFLPMRFYCVCLAGE